MLTKQFQCILLELFETLPSSAIPLALVFCYVGYHYIVNVFLRSVKHLKT